MPGTRGAAPPPVVYERRAGGSEAVYAQHSGAERCPGGSLESRGGRLVVYLAHGSHAAYFHAGTRDRMWPCTGRRCMAVGACDAGEAALVGGFGFLALVAAFVVVRRRRPTAHVGKVGG